VKRLERALTLAAFQLRRLGWAGATGIMLIAGALATDLWRVHDAEQRLQAARSEHAALRARLAAGVEAPPEARLASFYAALRAPAGEATAVEIVHAAARTHGVRLARGDYRLVRDSGGRLWRHQLALPVQASYPQLLAWLADVMNALPGASIDGITLKRNSVESEIVEAQVRLVVYVSSR